MSSIRTRMNAQDRRAAIIEAAVQLFSDRGFRGTTTRELAAAVGVSEPVLYEHFATKSDLYSAIIDAKSQEGAAKFNDALGSYLETDDDEMFFQKLAGLILRFYDEDSAYIRLLLYSGLEGHELANLYYERQITAFMTMVAGYIQRRQRQNAYRGDIDATLAARAFAGMVAHYGQGAVLFKRCALPFERQEIINGMVGIFLRGLLHEKDEKR